MNSIEGLQSALGGKKSQDNPYGFPATQNGGLNTIQNRKAPNMMAKSTSGPLNLQNLSAKSVAGTISLPSIAKVPKNEDKSA